MSEKHLQVVDQVQVVLLSFAFLFLLGNIPFGILFAYKCLSFGLYMSLFTLSVVLVLSGHSYFEKRSFLFITRRAPQLSQFELDRFNEWERKNGYLLD